MLFDRQELSAQTIALAGLLQALAQVQQCARNGEPSDANAVRVVLESVLRIDAPDAESVYGGLPGLRPGLNLLAQHLSRKTNVEHLEQTRYAASLMGLERRLSKLPTVASQLISDLREIDRTDPDWAIDEPKTVQRLASAYSAHISPLLPRVMISGEPIHLKAADNADRIRALLLAGLRAVVLWRQCGGGQIKLLLFRNAMQRAVADLLDASR